MPYFVQINVLYIQSITLVSTFLSFCRACLTVSPVLRTSASTNESIFRMDSSLTAMVIYLKFHKLSALAEYTHAHLYFPYLKQCGYDDISDFTMICCVRCTAGSAVDGATLLPLLLHCIQHAKQNK